MGQKIIAYDDTEERMVRTGIDPDALSGSEKRSGCESVTSGVATISVVYDTAFADTNYSLNVIWQNTVDSTPQFQPILITNKTTTGFTAIWNSNTDSANYELCYDAGPASLSVVGTDTISQGATSKAVTLSPAQPTATYIVVASLFNGTDSLPQFQTPVITNKATTGFTLKWNTPTDTANYIIEWQITAA